jgi:beta-lactamase class D
MMLCGCRFSAVALWFAVFANSSTFGAAAALVEGARPKSCFLLFEMGGGEVRRRPAEACDIPMSPASTFKIPHALAALDSGVISAPGESMQWDGQGRWEASARHPHTLASALRYSVVWYFQRIAQRLGMDREKEYLVKFNYGNEDPGSGLTTFWLGESLLITPVQQLSFLRRLYAGQLPVGKPAAQAVKAMLVEPRGKVVDARGERPFSSPWRADVVLSAKPGRINDKSQQGIRWLVGHVSRRDREYVFVSAVIGNAEVPADAAIDLAARSLREEGVL